MTVTPADKYSSETNTITVCEGTTVTLKANLINATGKKYHYTWHKKGILTSEVGWNSAYSVDQEGTYYVTVYESLHPVTTKQDSMKIKVVFEKHSNPLVPHGAKAATCTEEGHYAYWTCSKCNKLFANASGTTEYANVPTIPKKAHEITTHAMYLGATCTTEGHLEHWACTNCGAVFLDQAGKRPTTKDAVTLSATGHKMTKTEAKAATCTETGNNEYYTCNNCEKVFKDEVGTTETTVADQTIKANGHSLKKHDAVEPTCTTAGNYEYYTCGGCNKIFKTEAMTEEFENEAATIIPKTGHSLKKHNAVAPTCTDNGHADYWVCNNCGNLFADDDGLRPISEIEIIPANGHDVSDVDTSYTPEKPATCTEDGYEGYWTCKTCGKLFADEGCEKELSEPTIIPATGHKFGEWTVKKPAAIGTDGLKERVCEKCGYTETAVIPALEASKTNLNNKTELAKKTAESKSAEEKTDNSAKTGDDSSIALYALLALLAAGGAAGTVYRRKTNE